MKTQKELEAQLALADKLAENYSDTADRLRDGLQEIIDMMGTHAADTMYFEGNDSCTLADVAERVRALLKAT